MNSRSLLLASLLCAAARPSLATPKLPWNQIHEVSHPPAVLDGAPAYSLRSDTLARLALLAAFEKSMQYTTPCAPDAGASLCDVGGVIEVATGIGHTIVESDNTQEAIWDWSFAHRMAGAADFSTETAGAWSFLAGAPGWTEWMDGGGAGPDYYSVYNCGWGVRAVLEYEAATGDLSHHDYGVMCAQHLVDNGLAVASASNTLIDQATAAWGASGLWLWADATGNAAQKQSAAAIGARVKSWLDGDPTAAASTSWAASGGAVFYGVVNSYMKEHPSELVPWVTTMAPRLGGWVDESQPVVTPLGEGWRDWRNAWNAWNMLAHFAAASVLAGSDGDAHRQVALDIFGKLLAQDDDMNGGIQGSERRPNTEDQSWITSYLGYFGIREVLALSSGSDGGVDDMGAPPSGNHGGGGCAIGQVPSGRPGIWLGIGLGLGLGLVRRRRWSTGPGRGRSVSR